MSEPLQLDIVSDVICPWCFIGKRHLEAALYKWDGMPVRTSWRPFFLDPSIPEDGLDRDTYLARKFGSAGRGRSGSERIRQIGAEAGITFAFDKITRTPNTLNAHRLIRWALPAGHQDAVVERLFQLYFLEGADVGDIEVLVAAAEDTGMDTAQVRARFADDTDKQAVAQEAELAMESGITGVPTFVFDNRFGLTGAQEPETILRFLRKMEQKRD